jgi:hypothetical protein
MRVAVAANDDVVTVYTLDPSTMEIHAISHLDGIVGTEVAIDDDGTAYWVVMDSVEASLWSGSPSVDAGRVAGFPDPRPVGLYWTNTGLQLLRWFGAGLSDRLPGEHSSLVEATVADGKVVIGSESTDLQEVGVAPDGVTRALLLQRAAGRPVTIRWSEPTGDTDVGDYVGISNPSVAGHSVIVRRAEDGKLIAIDVRNGAVTVVRDSETLLGAVSSDGRLLSAAVKPGGGTELCVSSGTSASGS